ncbi:hypothetical protein K7432_010114 [Basidiobolus ranarum]|uniref:Uncharacterized protein n=1 Tax=Basidiobolus ranarum TaxID=34480 RepID=A0ABR2WP93_9FUNG
MFNKYIDHIKPETVSEGCTKKDVSEHEPAKNTKKRRKSKKSKKKMTDDKSEPNAAQSEIIVSEDKERIQPEASHEDSSHPKRSVESKEITSIDASKEMVRDFPNEDLAIPTIELDAANVKTTPRNIPRSPNKNKLSPAVRTRKLSSVDKEKENPIFISTDDHLSDGSYDSTFISELLQTQKKLSKEGLSSEQSLGSSDVLIKKEECSNVFKNITEPTIRIQKGFLTPQPKTAKLRPDFGVSPRLDRGKDIGLPNLGNLLRRTKGDSFSPLINSDRIDIKNIGGANFKGKNYIRHRVHSEASAQRPPTALLNMFEKNESFRNSPKSDMDLDVLPEGFATRRARLFRQQRSANVESEIAKKLEWLSAPPILGPTRPPDKRPPISPRSERYLHVKNGDPERLDTSDNDGTQELKLANSREAFVKRSYPSVENQSYTLPISPVYLCQLYEYSTDVIERIRSTEMTGLNRPMRRAFDVNELSKTSHSMLDDIVKEITNMHQHFQVAAPQEDSGNASKCSKSQSQLIGFKELIKLIQNLLKDMALLRMTSNDYTVAYYRLLDQKRQEATEEAGFPPNNTSSACHSRLQKTPRNPRAQPQPVSVTQLTPLTGTLISPVSHISGDLNLCTSQLSALISKSSPITPTAPTSEPEIWYNRFGIHRCHGYQHNSHIWCSSNRLDTAGLYESRGNPYY